MTNFKKTKVKVDSQTKKPYYVNEIYPLIPASDSDIYITTRNGDRLDLLAEEYYDNSDLYWVIASANPEKVRNDSFFVTPGIQIRIPADLKGVEIDYNKINTRR